MLTKEQIDTIIEEVRSEKNIQTILLTGSYVYGNPTDKSDLDIRCITNDGSDRAEFNRIRYNTVVQIFFNTPEKVKFYFKKCRETGNADCIHFWANGKLIYDINKVGLSLQTEARALYKAGPNKGFWKKWKKAFGHLC